MDFTAPASDWWNQIQLIRIEVRVPEYGWTTQKVFHLMNFIVNGARAIVFGFHKQVFVFKIKVFTLMLVEFPGLLFFSTYTLLVLFWAEIYHQASKKIASARSLPTDKLRIVYISVNGGVYLIQVALSAFDKDASLDVLDHPVLNLVYYLLAEILPSALVLFILRKLPPKRVSAQYHPIR
ncbi:hypothetical protein C5167_043005 [Papaver somniferum]|uniref:THH1/TOM1/TOM3 domain-containing protein n=1 Tax=Papaver somniferum TaxID=3469 RepID=A0A4Y7L4F4_PAPSO|nr:hypothetical protein C5167_043005 [Papaver somniferum]